MSLLMDALKKAEQAKRTQERDGDGPAPETPGALSLEPLELPPGVAEPSTATAAGADEAPRSARTTLPELPSQLEVLDQEFLAHVEQRPPPVKSSTLSPDPAPVSPPPKPAPSQPRPRVEPGLHAPVSPGPAKAAPGIDTPRDEARNVFAAKQAAPDNKKTFAIVVGASTLLAVAGIGVYFWLQLQPAGGLKALPQANTPAPPPPPPAPVSAPPPVAPAVAALPPGGGAVPATSTQPGPALAPGAPPAATAGAPRESTFASRPADAPSRAAEATRAPAQRAMAEPEGPIRITSGKLRINPSLTRGFDALNAGDLAAAEAEYAKVLKTEPKNADALHGMAAVALRQGQYGQAEVYYLRAIEADPRDPIAQAGIVGLKGQGDPVASISRLKNLLAAQPDQPFLHFALGNLYAGGERWHEAQQSFFKAWTGDPDNPDYLFNLAISLDQLHQARLAAQYYAQALAAAANRPANFDKAQATARLRDLQR